MRVGELERGRREDDIPLKPMRDLLQGWTSLTNCTNANG